MHKTKFLITTLIAVIILTCSFALAKTKFDDVSEEMEPAVYGLTTMEVMDGYADGEFKPQESMTRAKLAKLVLAANNMLDQVTEVTEAPYSDVDVKDWSSSYIALAKEKKLVSDIKDGTYGPENNASEYDVIFSILSSLGYFEDLGGTYIDSTVQAKIDSLANTLGFKGSHNAATRGYIATNFFKMLGMQCKNSTKTFLEEKGWEYSIINESLVRNHYWGKVNRFNEAKKTIELDTTDVTVYTSDEEIVTKDLVCYTLSDDKTYVSINDVFDLSWLDDADIVDGNRTDDWEEDDAVPFVEGYLDLDPESSQYKKYKDYTVWVVNLKGKNGEKMEVVGVEKAPGKGNTGVADVASAWDRIYVDIGGKTILIFTGIFSENSKTSNGYIYNTDKEMIVLPNEIVEGKDVTVSYHGSKISLLDLLGYDITKLAEKNEISISGDTENTEVGSYKATLKINNKEKYVWNIADPTTKELSNEDIVVSWRIDKNIAGILYNSSQKTLKSPKKIYNEKEQQVSLKDDIGFVVSTGNILNYSLAYADENKVVVSGDKATEIGEYEVTVSVKSAEHYVLIDERGEKTKKVSSVSFKWSIVSPFYAMTSNIGKDSSGASFVTLVGTDGEEVEYKFAKKTVIPQELLDKNIYELDKNKMWIGPTYVRVGFNDDELIESIELVKDEAKIDSYTIASVSSRNAKLINNSLRTNAGNFQVKENAIFFEVTPEMSGRNVTGVTVKVSKDRNDYDGAVIPKNSLVAYNSDEIKYVFIMKTSMLDYRWGKVLSVSSPKSTIELDTTSASELNDNITPEKGELVVYTLENDETTVNVEDIFWLNWLDEADVIDGNKLAELEDDDYLPLVKGEFSLDPENLEYKEHSDYKVWIVTLKGKFGERFEVAGVEETEEVGHNGVAVVASAWDRIHIEDDFKSILVFTGMFDEGVKTCKGYLVRTEKEIIDLPAQVINGKELYSVYSGKDIDVNKIGLDLRKEIEQNIVSYSGDIVAKEIGSYKVTLKINDKEKYGWSIIDPNTKDLSTDDIVVNWKIRKAEAGVLYRGSQSTLKKPVKTYNGKEQQVSLKDDIGIITSKKDLTNSTLAYVYDDKVTISGDKATNAGSYKVTVKVNDPAHYAIVDERESKSIYDFKELDSISFEWEIAKATAGELKQKAKTVSKTHSSREQEVTLKDFGIETKASSSKSYVLTDLVEITGNKAKKAGSYIFKISVKDANNYKLIDENGKEVNSIELAWEIKAQSTSSSGGGGGGGGGGSSSSAKTYRITTKVGSNGKISVSNPKVEEGKSQEFVFTPNSGYQVADVKVDGVSKGKLDKYVFENVKEKHTLEVKFEKATEENKDPAEPQTSNSNGQDVTPTTNTPVVKATEKFVDVNENDWFKDAVQFALDNGLFNGTSENEFSPNKNMNRAMVVTVLHRLAGKPNAQANNKFTDVIASEYYAEAVNWAVANGVVNGLNETTFGTNNNVTREQLVTILYRYAKSIGLDTKFTGEKLNEFVDKDEVEGYAVEAISWALEKGIINGRAEGRLAPKGTATRAEVATMIQRFLSLIK